MRINLKTTQYLIHWTQNSEHSIFSRTEDEPQDTATSHLLKMDSLIPYISFIEDEPKTVLYLFFIEDKLQKTVISGIFF